MLKALRALSMLMLLGACATPSRTPPGDPQETYLACLRNGEGSAQPFGVCDSLLGDRSILAGRSRVGYSGPGDSYIATVYSLSGRSIMTIRSRSY